MKFQYASDLHFEFANNREALGIESLVPSADILILAGDISVLKNESVKFLEYFNYFSKNWKKTYIIPGNHEFYGNGKLSRALHFELELYENVRYLNNSSIVFGEVEVFFSTLWSHCSSPEIKHMISDFRMSRWNDHKHTVSSHNKLHAQSVAYLDKAITASKAEKKVVISHFVPCPAVDNYPSDDKPGSSIIKEYFVADLSEYLKKWEVDYWIYGHNHSNNNVEVYGTQFLSNMHGYNGWGNEQDGFSRSIILEV